METPNNPTPIQRVSETVMDARTKALAEAIKIYGRNYLLVVVPTLIVFVLKGINLETGEILINWLVFKAVWLSESLGFVLIGLDRYKHIYIKETNPVVKESGKSAGIAPF